MFRHSKKQLIFLFWCYGPTVGNNPKCFCRCKDIELNTGQVSVHSSQLTFLSLAVRSRVR